MPTLQTVTAKWVFPNQKGGLCDAHALSPEGTTRRSTPPEDYPLLPSLAEHLTRACNPHILTTEPCPVIGTADLEAIDCRASQTCCIFTTTRTWWPASMSDALQPATWGSRLATHNHDPSLSSTTSLKCVVYRTTIPTHFVHDCFTAK